MCGGYRIAEFQFMKPKLDLYKTHKDEYATTKQPILLQMKPGRYFAISGQGAPGGDSFTARIGALYAVAFTVKMTYKLSGLQDYAICKLEGQWFFDEDPAKVPRDQWRWKLLIRTPDFVTKTDLAKATAALLKSGKPAEVKDVRLETIKEGRCVQMLHVGPYERERETVAKMRLLAEEKGLLLSGPLHEIYLSDPRRVPPERMKTILRQPVKKFAS
jgi:hypothetical protein